MSAEATVVRNYIETLVGLPLEEEVPASDISPRPRRCSTPSTTA